MMTRTTSEERLDRWERDSMRRKMDDAIQAATRRSTRCEEDDAAEMPGPPSALTYVLHCWLLQLERRIHELEWQNRRNEDHSRRWRAAFVTVSVVAIMLGALSSFLPPRSAVVSQDVATPGARVPGERPSTTSASLD